jgi:hypothetical protein
MLIFGNTLLSRPDGLVSSLTWQVRVGVLREVQTSLRQRWLLAWWLHLNFHGVTA